MGYNLVKARAAEGGGKLKCKKMFEKVGRLHFQQLAKPLGSYEVAHRNQLNRLDQLQTQNIEEACVWNKGIWHLVSPGAHRELQLGTRSDISEAGTPQR